MSEEERYFAFIEHYGKIDLVQWCKTEAEARKIANKWKTKDKYEQRPDPDEYHFYVGEILVGKEGV